MKLILTLIYITMTISCLSEKPEKRKAGDKVYEFIAEDNERMIADSNLKPDAKYKIAIVSHYTVDKENLPFIDLATENHKKYAKKHGYDYYFRNGNLEGYNNFMLPDYKSRTFQLGLYWQKILAVQKLLDEKENNKEKYDYVLWLDTDAIFTNMDKKIESFIEGNENIFFFISDDVSSLSPILNKNCVNAGVFLTKNNQEGKEFIKTIANSFKLYGRTMYPEQSSMQDFIYKYTTEETLETIIKDKERLKNFHNETRTRKCNNKNILEGVKVLSMREFNSPYPEKGEASRWDKDSFVAHFLAMKGNNLYKMMNFLIDCLNEAKKSNIDANRCMAKEKVNLGDNNEF